MFSGEGVFESLDRSSSPASSDVSVSSGGSSEYFSCFSESGSGLDSDDVSVSSEESCPKRTSRTNNHKSRTPSRKQSRVPPRKRNATSYLHGESQAKKPKTYPSSCDTYTAPVSTFLPISGSSLAHRRKKTTPVKLISSTEGKQRTLVTKKSKYMQATNQTLGYAPQLKPLSRRSSDDASLRRSSRFSDAKTGKPPSK